VNVSAKAIEMIKHHEGVRFKPYRCPAKLWTIGVGHVMYPSQGALPVERRMEVELRPEDNRTFTKDEVDAILANDLSSFERGVARMCPTGLTQGRFDALVSISFNFGLGTLQRSSIRMKHNRGEFDAAADAFLLYTKGGGKILPGLVKRRNDERALYLS
jgi:lysozyme